MRIRPTPGKVCGVNIDSGAYKFILLLHILAVVVGIGSQMLNGLYAAKAKKLGAAAGGTMQVNLEVSHFAEYFIYAIPVLGFALLGMSDGAFEVGQTWIWLSLVLYVLALGISHGVMFPSAKKMQAIGPRLVSGQVTAEDGATATALEKKLAAGDMTLNLLVVVLIGLMIWKPGL